MSEFKSVWSYHSFAHRIIRRNRYIRDSETDEFLMTLRESARFREEARLAKDSGFWRAQIGNDWREILDEDGHCIDHEPCPFSRKRMKPLPDQAREGRANPKGIPYLYGANKKETALAEVRPWLGQFISLAFFVVHRDMRLMSFVTEDPKQRIYLTEPEPKEREMAVWADIDRTFAKPVTLNDETAEYVPTQVIAELFKTEGFDGIAYRSAFGGGYNIALFDLDSADLVGCTLYALKDIKHEFHEAGPGYSVVERGEDRADNNAMQPIADKSGSG